jgi:hypothetical protein
MPAAIGTSLLVITINSAVALTTRLQAGARPISVTISGDVA